MDRPDPEGRGRAGGAQAPVPATLEAAAADVEPLGRRAVVLKDRFRDWRAALKAWRDDRVLEERRESKWREVRGWLDPPKRPVPTLYGTYRAD